MCPETGGEAVLCPDKGGEAEETLVSWPKGMGGTSPRLTGLDEEEE